MAVTRRLEVKDGKRIHGSVKKRRKVRSTKNKQLNIYLPNPCVPGLTSCCGLYDGKWSGVEAQCFERARVKVNYAHQIEYDLPRVLG